MVGLESFCATRRGCCLGPQMLEMVEKNVHKNDVWEATFAEHSKSSVPPFPAEPLHTGCMLTSSLEASVVRLLHRGPMERVFLRVLILKLSHSRCSCSSRYFLLTVVWVWKIAFFGLFFLFNQKVICGFFFFRCIPSSLVSRCIPIFPFLPLASICVQGGGFGIPQGGRDLLVCAFTLLSTV